MLKIACLSCIVLVICSCKERSVEVNTLEDTKALILNNKSVEYDLISVRDTRLNNTFLTDTTSVQKQRSNTNIHGFKCYTANRALALYYDGSRSLTVVHAERMLIEDALDEFSTDSLFFQHKLGLQDQPDDFLAIDSTFVMRDTTISDVNLHQFSKKEYDKTRDGSRRIIERKFLIDPRTGHPSGIVQIIIKGKSDTLQVLTNTFQDLRFSNTTIDFAPHENLIKELGYAEVKREDLAKAMESRRQAIGNRIKRSKFTSIDGEEVDLIPSVDGCKTVVMFSFVGCGGCEMAMRKMKAKSFAFKDNIQLYYSSRFDNAMALQQYKEQKAFPFVAFSKDSEMQSEFNPYFAPTFFVIESNGTISDVYEGYTEGVEAILF